MLPDLLENGVTQTFLVNSSQCYFLEWKIRLKLAYFLKICILEVLHDQDKTVNSCLVFLIPGDYITVVLPSRCDGLYKCIKFVAIMGVQCVDWLINWMKWTYCYKCEYWCICLLHIVIAACDYICICLLLHMIIATWFFLARGDCCMWLLLYVYIFGITTLAEEIIPKRGLKIGL